MELKVFCDCGQKFKFEVEPVGGLMPFKVNCPACGADGTNAANLLLAQGTPIGSNVAAPIGTPAAIAPIAAASSSAPPVPIPVPATASAAPAMPPATGGLRLNRPTPSEPPMPPPVSVATTSPAPPPSRQPMGGPAPTALPKYMQTNEATQNNSFIMGILGAFVGAIVGVTLMMSCSYFLGFKFPLFGTIVGAMIGFGARLFYKGTDTTLGAASAVIAFLVVGPALFVLVGPIGMLFSVISWFAAVYMAFKVASG